MSFSPVRVVDPRKTAQFHDHPSMSFSPVLVVEPVDQLMDDLKHLTFSQAQHGSPFTFSRSHYGKPQTVLGGHSHPVRVSEPQALSPHAHPFRQGSSPLLTPSSTIMVVDH
ncbi:hypothetical protein MMC28_003057, partial [Mycoblastus sanguinarius]|nr:hypothetical protein [Mycoblastus sanguinarius]